MINFPFPVSLPSFKALAQTVIRISWPQEKLVRWMNWKMDEWTNDPKAIHSYTLFDWLSFRPSKPLRVMMKQSVYLTTLFLGRLCLCWGFMAQSTQWGDVQRGQFTWPHFYWSGLVLCCAHSFARNRQLPFLNQLKRIYNCRKNTSWSNLH